MLSPLSFDAWEAPLTNNVDFSSEKCEFEQKKCSLHDRRSCVEVADSPWAQTPKFDQLYHLTWAEICKIGVIERDCRLSAESPQLESRWVL